MTPRGGLAPAAALLLFSLPLFPALLRAADDAAPAAAAPSQPAVIASWHASDAGLAFRGKMAGFLKKVGADERLDFKVPELEAAMVFVVPGKFLMGDEGGEDDEHPETAVTISRGFWLGRYEITQEEWREIMKVNSSHFKGAQRPAEFVSWKSATEFCKRLTERERSAGRLPRGYVYRLPTEAEWEYTCRLGVQGSIAGVLPDTGWYAVNAKEMTHPVGTKRANALGIYDMFGNVSEWCFDWFAKYQGTPVTDPIGPESGDFRVARGGCSFDIAYGCRPSYRTGAEVTVRSAGIGMRLALAPDIER